jgi:hypothetical protein
MSDSLDCSWIQTEQKIANIEKNYIREPIDDIKMYFIYINYLFEIEHVVKEIEFFDYKDKEDKVYIDKERLLKIIQEKRHHNNKKYRLDDILSFQIDLEPENIASFSELEDIHDIASSFLKSVPIFDEIICIPSIFIFHDIASLYFFFHENNAAIKSILRASDAKNRITKKVRIMDADASMTEGTEDIDIDLDDSRRNKRKSIRKFMKKMKYTRKKNNNSLLLETPL